MATERREQATEFENLSIWQRECLELDNQLKSFMQGAMTYPSDDREPRFCRSLLAAHKSLRDALRFSEALLIGNREGAWHMVTDDDLVG